jgi:hypothetical protein
MPRWDQGILEAWGGTASQLVVDEIVLDVGRASWEQFLQMLNSGEEYELAEADDENVEIIMQGLGLYGTVVTTRFAGTIFAMIQS